MNALIIGPRHSGKSKLIDRIIAALGCTVGGFRTKNAEALEDPERGVPTYFHPVGEPESYSEDNLLGHFKPGNKCPYPAAFDRKAAYVAELGGSDIVIMDELGFIENCSPSYCEAVKKVLAGDTPVLAALRDKQTDFLDELKTMPESRCFFLTRDNADAVFHEVLAFMKEQLIKNEIKTERLVIRPYRTGDEQGLMAILSDAQVKKTFILPDYESEEACKKHTERIIAMSQNDGRYVRGVSLDGYIIGMVNEVGKDGDTIEVGYAFNPLYWGRGYATETLKSVLSDLRARGYKKVSAAYFEENPASMRVMEKAGMAPTDITEDIEYRGAVHHCIYREISWK